MSESFENLVRTATYIIDEHQESGFYRGLFHKGNFYLYRHVEKGPGYRGNTYPEGGYVLAFADHHVHDPNMISPPSFIPMRCD